MSTPRVMRQGLTSLATTVAILTTAVRAEAKDNNAFYELEPKFIFAFTIGSSIEIEGEKAFEPDTVANFGKRDASYTALKPSSSASLTEPVHAD
jgi:hypothetical protein